MSHDFFFFYFIICVWASLTLSQGMVLLWKNNEMELLFCKWYSAPVIITPNPIFCHRFWVQDTGPGAWCMRWSWFQIHRTDWIMITRPNGPPPCWIWYSPITAGRLSSNSQNNNNDFHISSNCFLLVTEIKFKHTCPWQF